MKIVIVMFTILAMISCTNGDDCDAVLPAPPIAYISVVDAQGNSLLGPNNEFDIAEISLFNQDEAIIIGQELIDNRFVIMFFHGRIVSGTDYTLRFNETVSDVINIDFSVNEGSCFNTRSIEEFRFNSEIISGTFNVYTLVK